MKPGKIRLIFELNTGTRQKNRFGDEGFDAVKYSGVKPMFRLLSLRIYENGLHQNCIDQENIFLVSKVELIDVLSPFKIPYYLRTRATGVRTSEKFRPLAPQDE